MDHLRAEAALDIERTDFLGVVDRAGNPDQLTLRSGLPELLKLLKAAIDDVLVA
jgi:hypothetical protein